MELGGGGRGVIQQLADFFSDLVTPTFFSFRSSIIKRTIFKFFLKKFTGQFSKELQFIGFSRNKN